MAKSVSIKVDFSNVEVTDYSIPNGTYVLTVTGVKKKRSDSSGADYLAWEYKVAEGKFKGRKVWDNTSLQPQALWRLRAIMEAMGMEIEDGEVELDLDDFDGETVGAEIENEKYQGKDKPRIVSFISVDNVEGGGEEEPEENPAKKSAAKTVAKPAKAAEPEEEEEEEAPPPKAAKKTTAKKKAAEPEYEVGQKVSFDDDGTTHTGVITAIDGDSVTVKVKKDEWEIDISEISAA